MGKKSASTIAVFAQIPEHPFVTSNTRTLHTGSDIAVSPATSLQCQDRPFPPLLESPHCLLLVAKGDLEESFVQMGMEE